MQKDDDFLKSPTEAPVHRKVLLEDRNISPKTQEAFDKLCEKYDDIISKNSGDIGKTIVKSKEGLWAFIHGKSCFSGLQSPLGITNGNRSHNKPLELI